MTTTTITPTTSRSRKRTIAFYVPLVLFIVVAILFMAVLPPVPLLFYVFVGWANPMEAIGMHHHHYHEFVASAFMLTAVAGCAVQFSRARSKAAPMLQAAIALLLWTAVAIVTGSFSPPFLFFLVPILAATALHPAGIRNLFKSSGPLNRPLLGLTAIAAIPLILYALEHLGLQAGAIAGDDHAEFNHWGTIAAASLSIIAFGLLASFRLSGWRITAWSAAAIAFVLGLTSVLFPEQASAVGSLWGGLAIVWAIAFGLTAQFGDRLISSQS